VWAQANHQPQEVLQLLRNLGYCDFVLKSFPIVFYKSLLPLGICRRLLGCMISRKCYKEMNQMTVFLFFKSEAKYFVTVVETEEISE
jgi:hypothetical protein